MREIYRLSTTFNEYQALFEMCLNTALIILNPRYAGQDISVASSLPPDIKYIFLESLKICVRMTIPIPEIDLQMETVEAEVPSTPIVLDFNLPYEAYDRINQQFPFSFLFAINDAATRLFYPDNFFERNYMEKLLIEIKEANQQYRKRELVLRTLQQSTKQPPDTNSTEALLSATEEVSFMNKLKLKLERELEEKLQSFKDPVLTSSSGNWMESVSLRLYQSDRPSQGAAESLDPVHERRRFDGIYAAAGEALAFAQSQLEDAYVRSDTAQIEKFKTNLETKRAEYESLTDKFYEMYPGYSYTKTSEGMGGGGIEKNDICSSIKSLIQQSKLDELYEIYMEHFQKYEDEEINNCLIDCYLYFKSLGLYLPLWRVEEDMSLDELLDCTRKIQHLYYNRFDFDKFFGEGICIRIFGTTIAALINELGRGNLIPPRNYPYKSENVFDASTFLLIYNTVKILCLEFKLCIQLHLYFFALNKYIGENYSNLYLPYEELNNKLITRLYQEEDFFQNFYNLRYSIDVLESVTSVEELPLAEEELQPVVEKEEIQPAIEEPLQPVEKEEIQPAIEELPIENTLPIAEEQLVTENTLPINNQIPKIDLNKISNEDNLLSQNQISAAGSGGGRNRRNPSIKRFRTKRRKSIKRKIIIEVK